MRRRIEIEGKGESDGGQGKSDEIGKIKEVEKKRVNCVRRTQKNANKLDKTNNSHDQISTQKVPAVAANNAPLGTASLS